MSTTVTGVFTPAPFDRSAGTPPVHDFPPTQRRVQHRTSNRNRRRGKRRFDDDEPTSVKRVRTPGAAVDRESDATDGLPEGDRWSTWDQSIPTQRGPRPHPGWLVTELAAVDTELGILKTGKEADVFLVRRGVPGGRSCLLAAKRYRDAGHRMFHRDGGYLEGRRVRESRVNRAVASRTAFGREAIAGQWAYAEFGALSRLYAAGIPGALSGADPRHRAAARVHRLGGRGGRPAAGRDPARPGRAGRAVGPAGAGARRPGQGRPGPRRPVRVQPAGARRAAGDDRPAAGGQRGREPARRLVPHPRRGERRPLVHGARPEPEYRAPNPRTCPACSAAKPCSNRRAARPRPGRSGGWRPDDWPGRLARAGCAGPAA